MANNSHVPFGVKTAEALATFEHDYYAGSSAVAGNSFGTGTAFHVGTVPDQSGMNWLLDQVYEAADVRPIPLNLPAGVELVRCTNGTQTWLFALNHLNEEVNIPLDLSGYNLLSHSQVDKSLRLAPREVAIIQQ